MQRAIVFCLLLLMPLVTAAAEPASPATARPWPHEQSDMKPDARVRWGKLDNGLRYAILPTKSAPARGSLRMLVLAGSGQENDDQQGVAHFLEHMAFNGTKHFAAGETFEYFQRLGMAFGAHTNALTEIDRTIYKLELPRANEELTADGLKLFRDFLDGILLDEKEIEKERGVVLSEQTASNSPGYRSAVGAIRSALAGTKAAERMPIGKTDTIRKATRKQFVDFYETWYTPGRTLIVAVGDFDPAMVERSIRTHFADARARRGEADDVSLGKLRKGGGLKARYAPIPDAGGTTVSISRSTPVRPTVEKLADQREDIVDVLLDRMFNQRLQRLTEMNDSPLLSAAMDDDRLYNLAIRRHVSARSRPEKWTDALSLLERETRRAVRDGFSETELASAKDTLKTIFDYVVAQHEMQQPSEATDAIVKSVYERSIYSDPADMQDLLKELFPKIDKAECDARFRKLWDSDDREISVTGDAELKEDPSGRILAAYSASAKQPLESTIDAETKEFVYTDFGPEGKIASRREHQDLGVIQAVFANNVRVNVKRTTVEKNRVRMIVRFGGGLLELPADKPGLQHFASSTFIAGGLKKLTLTDLNRRLAGKFASVAFSVGEEAFQLSGACLASNLDLELQLAAAYLTEPAFRPETESDFFTTMDAIYDQRDHTLEGALRYDGAAFLRSNDARYALPSKEAIHKLKISDVAAWLAKPLAEGYLEVSLVGDVDPDAALKLVAKTLGALSKREAAKPGWKEARRLKFPVDTRLKELRYAADAPRALAAVCWPVPGAGDTTLCRRLTVLNLILEDRLRLKLREELGAAYTPEATYFSTDAYPDYGFIGAYLLVDPANPAKLAATATEVAAELATGSISDDEFARAINPYLSEIDSDLRNNSYWLGSICDSQERPESLDIIRSRKEAYAKMAKADVEALAKQYLSREAATTITIAPKPAASSQSAQE